MPGVSTTLVSDNVDWKNKSIRGSSNETYHRNCIFIQQENSCYVSFKLQLQQRNSSLI